MFDFKRFSGGLHFAGFSGDRESIAVTLNWILLLLGREQEEDIC